MRHRGGHGRAGLATAGLTLAAAVLLGACAPPPSAPDRPVVAVSVLPHADLVDQLAGDLVHVAVLIPPGASPATHQPTVQELRALEQAILYVKVGHDHFPFEEAWLERLLAERPELPVVDSMKGVEHVDHHDPHVWLVPTNALTTAASVAAELSRALPDHAELIAGNLDAFRRRVEALDAELRETLAGARGKQFLVFHPAWGNFAEAFGLRQVAIEDHGKEPDARELGLIIERAREAGVKVVFGQPQFASQSVDVVAEEIGARVDELDPLARDWETNLREAARKIAAAAVP